MYRELIEKQAVTNKSIKPQVGATEKEILKAEEELNVTFPEELRTLLSEMNGDEYLFFSIAQIVERNKVTREILGDEYDGLNNLLFFGGNGCGDYYSYFIKEKKVLEKNIVCWEHEANECISVAKDISELINRYFNDEI